MQRKLLVVVWVVFTVMIAALPVWAANNCKAEFSCAKPIKVYALDLYTNGFGLKEVLGSTEPGWQLTLNAKGVAAQNLEFQVGAVYRIPDSFFGWRFYGGGGLEYRYKYNVVAPYVVGGSEFVSVFFAEQGFTLEETSHTFARSGFRFRF